MIFVEFTLRLLFLRLALRLRSVRFACHPLQGSYASSGCKIALTREFVWLGFGDVLGANIKSTWAHTSFSNTLHHGIQDGGHQYTESITSVYVLF